MAQSSAAAAAAGLNAFAFGFLPPVSEKLTRGNYSMWLAQVTATLQGAQLWGYTKPTSKPPPEFLPEDVAAVAAAPAANKQTAPAVNLEYEKWFA